MDLRKASSDDIAAELARRNEKFVLIMVDTKKVSKKGAELHCGNMLLPEIKKIVKESLEILESEVVADNVTMLKRTMVNGEIVKEEKLKSTRELEEMDIEMDKRNEIGNYDPWVEKLGEE